MYHILKSEDASSVQRSENDWLEASMVWIEPKSDANGAAAKEGIYKVHAAPDIFRQVFITDEFFIAGANRDDCVLVDARVLQDKAANTERKFR